MKKFIVILLIILGFLQYKLWFGPDGFTYSLKLKNELAVEAKKNDKLEKQNAHLLAKIKDLKNGNSSIEELARNNMGLIKPDETYYRVVK